MTEWDDYMRTEGRKEYKMQGVLGPEVYSICRECAKVNGAVWPKVHCATFWYEQCDVCGETKALCDVSDYNWPKGKRPSTWNIHRRD